MAFFGLVVGNNGREAVHDLDELGGTYEGGKVMPCFAAELPLDAEARSVLGVEQRWPSLERRNT